MSLVHINYKLRKYFFKPIHIIFLYFIFIYILYLFGPLEWKTQNPFFLFVFLLLSNILLYVGFSYTIRNQIIKYKKNRHNNILIRKSLSEFKVLKSLRILILINLVMSIMLLIRNTGLSSFSLNEILANFFNGISNAGLQYSSKFQTEKVFGGDILAPLTTLLSPILWPVLPLSIYYFKKINLFYKFLVILTIITESIRWISIGTNKGIIEISLIIVAILFIKKQQQKVDGEVKKNVNDRKVLITVITIIILILGLSIFENNISSRIDGNYYIISSMTNNTEINMESPIMKIVPESIHPLVIFMSTYLTQGLYGLSLTLDEPFIPMFGIGNSYFLISNFQDLLNVDIWQYTYQYRVLYKGWDPLVNWHTIYSWLANDISYLGVLLVMLLLGSYLAIVYFRTVINKDPIAIVLFCMLVLMFFYFPMNNQILSYPSTFMSFTVINIYWFYKIKIRKRG